MKRVYVAAVLGLTLAVPAQAVGQAQSALVGRWDLTLTDSSRRYPSWLEVERSGNHALVGRFVGVVGSARPVSKIEYSDSGFRFSIPPQWEQGDSDVHVEGVLKGDQLSGSVTDPAGKRYAWTGTRAPALDRATPPRWGAPVVLFNGTDMAKWQTSGDNWRVVNRVLTNIKPGANIVTRDKFGDFKLHIEFRYPKQGNSGVYLRGRYEVQVEDNDSLYPAQDHLAAIYGFLAPSHAAPRQPGVWQTYDITLVGRHVTVVLNGKTLLSDQEIPGITGGALDSNEGEPGPLLLQGDHTAVEYRNIVLTPAR